MPSHLRVHAPRENVGGGRWISVDAEGVASDEALTLWITEALG